MKRKSIFKKLPRKAKIGRSKEYKICYEDLTEEQLCGIICDVKNLLRVCKTQSRENIESTLIHEIIHGIDFSKRIGLSERQVLKLEAGLMQMFRRNGWRIEF